MIREMAWFIRKKQLTRDRSAKVLSGAYMKKARANIVTMELLSKATDFRDVLGLPKDYDSNEWVVITAYYSMYMAALSVLAKLGLRSKNHTATVTALEELFVSRRLLERGFLEILEKVRLQKDEIEELRRARERREIAQYSVTKRTTRELAGDTRRDAHKFVDRMEEILDSLG